MTYRKAPFPAACAVAALLAQACVQYAPTAAYYPPPPSQPDQAPQPAAPAADLQRLDAIVGPIALYPDPLLAIILPASTAPADIVAASVYLVQYGDMSRIDGQPWDPSVRALAHYPTVVTWMAQNIEWTRALGREFASSPSAVMDSVQRLRARAEAAGALASTNEQQVIPEDGGIEILPAQPGVIYVPAYDSDVVFSDEPYYGFAGPFFYFGEPFAVGAWLNYSLDWHRHRLWTGRGDWRGPGGWRPPRFDGDHAPPGARPWQPGKATPGSLPQDRGAHPLEAPVPRPMPGTPIAPPSRFRSSSANPGQPGVAATAVPLPRTPAPPAARPRLALPAASESTSRRPAESAPGGALRSDPPAGASEPTYAGHEPARAPAQAPARAAVPAPVAHSAPAPAPAPAAASSSGDSGGHQPSK